MIEVAGGKVILVIDGRIANITFDRPEALNALTFAMYQQLLEICAALQPRRDLTAIVFRGAGKAFVAGTDISEFRSFVTGVDGLAYERRVETVIAAIEALPATTLAIIDGPAMGGGLVISSVCDFRIISDHARFGAPIAKTVGNCLSTRNVGRIERVFGNGATRKMLLLAIQIDAREAMAAGAALECVPRDQLQSSVAALLETLATNAPLTLAATRESLLSLGGIHRSDDEPMIARVYASADFKEGVDAFLGKRKPQWTRA